MNTYADKSQENANQWISKQDAKNIGGRVVDFQYTDNRTETMALARIQEIANNSPQVHQLKVFQEMADNRPEQQHPIQKQANNTGLSDNLKSGIENLSGYSMNDVKVHYNSNKPRQLQAYAYAQGTDIHLAPGQEKHLPHEAWHVVQQKQGRVKPTRQMKGKVNINDDTGLENEADVMGAKAMYSGNYPAVGQKAIKYRNQYAGTLENKVTQRAVGLEFQTYKSNTDLEIYKSGEWEKYGDDVEERYAQGQGIKVEKDGGDLEFVTNAFAESDAGRAGLIRAMRTMVITALNLENRVTSSSDIFRTGPGLAVGPHARDAVRVNSQGYIKAQPQATVGVQLSSLSTLLETLAKAGKRDSTEDLSAIFATEMDRPRGRKTRPTSKQPQVLASELGKNINDRTQKTFSTLVYPQSLQFARAVGGKSSPSMHGFLELLGLYIFGSGTQSKYAKSRTPIISRTNLADVFNKFSYDEQEYFVTHTIPKCAEYLATKRIIVKAPMYRHYPHGEEEASGMTREAVGQINIDGWLRGFYYRQDALAGLEGLGVIANANNVLHPDPSDYRQKWFSDAYGADLQMQQSTDIGGREKLKETGMSPHRLNGIVLELRNLGDDQLDVSEWATFAVTIFDLIVLVNSRDFEEMIALSKSMLSQRSFESDLGDVRTPGIFAGAKAIKKKVEQYLISAALSQGAKQDDLTNALVHWYRYIDEVD